MAKLEDLNAKVQPVMDVFSKVEKSELSQDKARNAKYFHDTYKVGELSYAVFCSKAGHSRN